MATIRPNALPAAASVAADDAVIVDDGVTVSKATSAQIVDAATPLASQAEAETGSNNTKRMTPLRVKQAMDANMATTAALASSDAGKGVSMLGLEDGRNLQAYINDLGAYNAAIHGMSASATGADNATALQAAIDHVVAIGGLVLQLPPGDFDIDGDITINSRTTGDPVNDQFIMVGAGAGERNGTRLNFSSGSLKITAINHVLKDFHVTSTDDGIVYVAVDDGTDDAVDHPTRSMMMNVRVEDCGGSGIVLQDIWIYQLINVFCRRNAEWGIEGKVGALDSVACNNLHIQGGEFQANGTIVSSGASRGTGGAIKIARGVQITLLNAAIEGNYGDGVWVDEQVRGLKFINCYFEKNGTHPSNRDITNFVGSSLPSSSTNGPNSVVIENCNFTPQNYNGTAQERAIDLYDVQDLKIVHPQFFAQSGPVVYSAEPIRVQEQTAGRCTGWVEGYYFGNSGYTQNVLKNACERFGFPTRYRFSPALVLPDGASTTSGPFVAPMSSMAGSRVDVNHWIIPGTWTGATPTSQVAGVAHITTTIRRGLAGTQVAGKVNDVNLSSATNAVKTSNNTSSTSFAGTFCLVTLTRDGTHANDTLAGDITVLSLGITTYEGVVSAMAIS